TPERISLPGPDFVNEDAEVLSDRVELIVRSEAAYWCTTRSAALAPLSVPPVIVVTPLPVTSKPPELSVNVPSSVTVAAAVSLSELIFVPSPTSAIGLPLKLTLLVGSQSVGSVVLVYPAAASGAMVAPIAQSVPA